MNMNYINQLQDEVNQIIDGYNPNIFPAFHQTVQDHFPGTLSLKEYMKKTYEALLNYRFDNDNTMGMVAICRDEITDPLFDAVIKYWGKTFNCCSLAGFVMMGKTGLASATDHTPIFEGLRRFTFYAMPHIAISRYGDIGKVYREGIEKASHACGALEVIVNELKSGHLNLETDMEDIEQTIIRQKILSKINYGDKPDLVEITKLASQIIFNDVEKLLSPLDTTIFQYAVMTGIFIHGPLETQWIYPQNFYVVGNDIPNGKEIIEVFQGKD
ncbi:hypothetical protein [Limnofasciculus baicalensis]